MIWYMFLGCMAYCVIIWIMAVVVIVIYDMDDVYAVFKDQVPIQYQTQTNWNLMLIMTVLMAPCYCHSSWISNDHITVPDRTGA